MATNAPYVGCTNVLEPESAAANSAQISTLLFRLAQTQAVWGASVARPGQICFGRAVSQCSAAEDAYGVVFAY